MLGGGNPARIPEMEDKFRNCARAIIDGTNEFEDLAGSYDDPAGNRAFAEVVAALLRDRYGWPLEAHNVALTNGSQMSFYFLFNLLAGWTKGGEYKKILLPTSPEYIGYSDVGIDEELFISVRPEIELIGADLFKYHIDFDALDQKTGDAISLICVSRPTNPTSNVITATELDRLNHLALTKEVPLIVDNAYGSPFPDILFTNAEPIWNENIILTMSLSKLGLPGLRTGIIIANQRVVKAVSAFNAIATLAPGSFGPVLVTGMFADGSVLDLSRDVIRPFYEKKCTWALECLRKNLAGLNYRIHKPEGTFFFWIWFENLSISTKELYLRLKARHVLVLPGKYFFPGLEGQWRHKDECIRLNYSQDNETVERAIEILAEELRKIV